jgi:hypothetical protein
MVFDFRLKTEYNYTLLSKTLNIHVFLVKTHAFSILAKYTRILPKTDIFSQSTHVLLTWTLGNPENFPQMKE